MRPLKSFRAARWIRTLNLVAQAVLFVTLFGGLNYVAQNHHWRFDLTQFKRHSLSPETLSYLQNLSKPVRIVVTLTRDSSNREVAQAYNDVRSILREYIYATESVSGGRIAVDFINVYENLRAASSLGIDQENAVVVICGEKRRVVTLDEIYKVKNGKKEAFQGEQAITAAILDVSSPKKNKIYFLSGHAEMRIDNTDPGRGLSQLRDELRLRNFEVSVLDLNLAKSIPEDATLLIAASPQTPFRAVEVELLRQYLSKQAGRLILLFEPRLRNGLDSLLDDWGIVVDYGVIFERAPEYKTDTGDLIVQPPQVKDPHPIVRTIVNYQVSLQIGQACSVRPDEWRPRDNVLVITPLIKTSASAWGERGYNSSGMPIDPQAINSYTPGIDLPGPLPLATASERVDAGALPFSVRRGRLVAMGFGDIVSNNRLGTPGNLPFFMGAVNWCADRDTQFNIPPRPIEEFKLAMSQEQFSKLKLALLCGLPGIAAVLGVFVYWSRRR